MATTKVFKSGNSQAVRLPKDFQFDVDEVEIIRRGDEVVLRKTCGSVAAAFQILGELSDDFFSDGRQQPPVQRRGAQDG